MSPVKQKPTLHRVLLLLGRRVEHWDRLAALALAPLAVGKVLEGARRSVADRRVERGAVLRTSHPCCGRRRGCERAGGVREGEGRGGGGRGGRGAARGGAREEVLEARAGEAGREEHVRRSWGCCSTIGCARDPIGWGVVRGFWAGGCGGEERKGGAEEQRERQGDAVAALSRAHTQTHRHHHHHARTTTARIKHTSTQLTPASLRNTRARAAPISLPTHKRAVASLAPSPARTHHARTSTPHVPRNRCPPLERLGQGRESGQVPSRGRGRRHRHLSSSLSRNQQQGWPASASPPRSRSWRAWSASARTATSAASGSTSPWRPAASRRAWSARRARAR
jgi:hypothetical protein